VAGPESCFYPTAIVIIVIIVIIIIIVCMAIVSPGWEVRTAVLTAAAGII